MIGDTVILNQLYGYDLPEVSGIIMEEESCNPLNFRCYLKDQKFDCVFCFFHSPLVWPSKVIRHAILLTEKKIVYKRYGKSLLITERKLNFNSLVYEK